MLILHKDKGTQRVNVFNIFIIKFNLFTFLNYILNALFSILLTSVFHKSLYLNIRYWHGFHLLFIY